MLKFLRKNIPQLLKIRFYTKNAIENKTSPNYIEFCGNWVLVDKNNFLNDMIVEENFLSEKEEMQLFNEVEPYMKRLLYEFDHWDDVCMTTCVYFTETDCQPQDNIFWPTF